MRAGGIDEASAHHAAGRHRRRGVDHARMELQVPRGRGRAGVPHLLQPPSRGQRSVSPRGRGRPPPRMGAARRLSVRQGRGEMMTRHASGSPQRTFMKTTIGMKTMKTTMGWIGALLVASASSAAADEAEHLAMARVRLTTEPSVARGCTRVGQVSDDSVKDLRRKIVRSGGDVGVLSFSTDNMSNILAVVYRCPAPATPASAAPRTAPPTAAPPAPPPPPPKPPR